MPDTYGRLSNGREYNPPTGCYANECHKREQELLSKNDGDGKGKQHENAKNQLALDGKDKEDVEKYAKALGLSTQEEILDPKNGCTKCHTTVYSARNRLITAGVTCQICHGGAGGGSSSYLQIHQDIRRKEEPNLVDKDPSIYLRSMVAGLGDMRRGPAAWVPICVECHVLGASPTERKLVDAGHPNGKDFSPLIDKVTPLSKHWYRPNPYKSGDIQAIFDSLAKPKMYRER